MLQREVNIFIKKPILLQWQCNELPIASSKEVIYNEMHDDWMMLVRIAFTLPFNKRVIGSSEGKPYIFSF